MKTYHFLPVFVLLVACYVGLHSYAARWLARSFLLPAQTAAALRAALLAAAFLSPFTLFLKRWLPLPWLEPLYAAGYAWMGVILIAATLFACADLAALALRGAAWFSRPALGAWTLAALAAAVAWSVYGGQRLPALREITVEVKGLPPALEGFRIAQVSDMHVDALWKEKKFARIVEAINAASPDLVVFTGDLIDPGITCREELSAAAARLKSRLGVYGCLGNHEYYYGLDKAADCYKAFGIKLLKNEAADLGPLRVVGLGDIHTEHLTREDVTGILDRNKDGKFTLLLSHQPVFYREIAAQGDYLVLSGHTHRGQIFPFHLPTWAAYRYFYGLYRIKNSSFYVSSGAGTWGPALRWLSRAEVPVIILKNAP